MPGKTKNRDSRTRFKIAGISFEGPTPLAIAVLIVLLVFAVITQWPRISELFGLNEPVEDPALVEQVNRLVEETEQLIAGLQDGKEPSMYDFHPSGFDQCRNRFQEILASDLELNQRIRVLTANKKVLRDHVTLAQRRRTAYVTWHEVVLEENGERKLGGASGRYIRVNAGITCSPGGDGTLTGKLVVVYGARSNNEIIRAKGVFRLRSPFLNKDFEIKARAGKDREEVWDTILDEAVLLDFRPSDMHISRDYE